MKKQSGIALILVLLITGILAMLVTQLSLVARQHVRQSQLLVERAQLRLDSYSLEAQLLFGLLTQSRNQPKVVLPAEGSVRHEISMEGTPVEVPDGVVAIQDVAGLLMIPAPTSDTVDFLRLLIAMGVKPEEGRNYAAALSSALMGRDQIPLQSFNDLAKVSGLDIGLIEQLREVSTFYPTTILNPATAPEPVLMARYGDDAAQRILRVRSKDYLSEGDFASAMGRDLDPLESLVVGPGFRISVSLTRGRQRVYRMAIWTVAPTLEDAPIRLWSSTE